MSVEAIGLSSPSFSEEELDLPKYRPGLKAVKDRLTGSVNPYYAIIDVTKTAEQQTSRSISEVSEVEIKKKGDEINQLAQEQLEAMDRRAKEVQSRDTWGILGTVAQYITTASTIVLGAACIASGVGTVPGALLIASGGLGLFNRVMTDTGGWQAVASWFTKSEELQIEIAHWIDMSCFFVSLGLGLAGGIWAYQAGALGTAAVAGRDAVMQNIAKITALAGGGMQVATRIGGAAADKRIAEIEGNNSIAESLKTVGYENNSEIAREAGSMIEMTKTLIDSTQSSFNSSIISK